MASEKKSIAGLIDYIDARQKDFRARIKGADEFQIEQLNTVVKQLAGFDLPPDYREFLAAMGAADTPFSFTGDAVHLIEEVLEKHQILIEDGDRLPPDSFLIAVYGFQVEEIALECFAGKDEPTRSGCVFLPNGERGKRILSDDFLKYLYAKAFQYVVGTDTPLTGTLLGKRREPNLSVIEKVAADYGLERQWFSDSINFCACDAAEKTVVYARQIAGENVWTRVSGNDRKIVVPLKESLANEADLNFEKWWN
jgi:hypothetical protein